MSYLQHEGHSAHITKIHIQVITPCCLGYIPVYYTQLLSLIQWCFMALQKVVSQRSKCTLIQNMCPDHNSLLCSWIWIIYNTSFVHNQMILSQSRISKATVQTYPKSVSGQDSKFRWWNCTIFHTIQGCVMTLTQGRIAKVKVTAHT